MPIAGIGIDIVHIERMKHTWEKHGDAFLEKSFTESEINTCKSNKRAVEMFAARFAAKEAVMKAFGKGMFQGVHFKDIEIMGGMDSKPEVKLHGEVKTLAEQRNITKILVSMTHEKDYAAAVAVVET